MKKILPVLILLYSLSAFAQETKIKEYSYSEFFELINNETDTIFKLKNAVVKYDSKTDKQFLVSNFLASPGLYEKNNRDKLVIDKSIFLENVVFATYINYETETSSSIHNVVFEEDVIIQNSFNIIISDCVFKKRFRFNNYDYDRFTAVKKIYPEIRGSMDIFNSEFLSTCRVVNSATLLENKSDLGLNFRGNLIGENCSRIFIANWLLSYVNLSYNTFNSTYPYYIQTEEISGSRIEHNIFNNGIPQFYCIEQDELSFKENHFNVHTLINFKATNNVNFIGVNQFHSTTSSLDGYTDYKLRLQAENKDFDYWESDNFKIFNQYNTEEKIKNLTTYQYELDQKSVFYNHFKDRHNTAEANKFYIEIKELESKRLAYEHNLNPSFNTFFKIQINKFLKLFSNYGTEPERAVMVSLYVILFFALIYLFFPNSWDRHGRRRIMDRYRFFTKYMNQEAGIHEVYLEEQEAELLESEDFKNYMQKAGKTIPKFFIATAMPLYKWSVSGTKLSAAILKRVDIMRGSWNELPKSKRVWKSFLLIGAFVVAIIYDLFIKMLNALMLSINTFTTLGFGEIPIRGLPRYLAIIQGFIGWFMLTIFSVSLISQLLN